MKKINKIILALVLFTGAFFLQSNTFFGRIPKNVIVGSVQVGRMSVREAKEKIRGEIALQVPTLTVETNRGEFAFSYPEIDFLDNLDGLLPSVKKNGNYPVSVTYYLTDTDGVCDNIAGLCGREEREPFVCFDGSFEYFEGETGIICDKTRLKQEILRSLAGDFSPVTLKSREVFPKKTVENLREDTRLLSEFTTYFDEGNAARTNNIALAARSVNGTILRSGEEFSFNRKVGRRTRARGYAEAKIIVGGEFVYGVGGGVCQASTTVYNAALLCGMQITKVSPHSLAVSYVEPSFDAMVSSASDLSFVNPFPYPVYLSAFVKDNGVTVRFYGRESGITYQRKSEVIKVLTPEESLVVYGEEEGVKRREKKGIVSKGSILKIKDGVIIEEKSIRKDEYRSVRGILLKKKEGENQSNWLKE